MTTSQKVLWDAALLADNLGWRKHCLILVGPDTSVILNSISFKLRVSLQNETEVHLVNDQLFILEYYCGSITSMLRINPLE